MFSLSQTPEELGLAYRAAGWLFLEKLRNSNDKSPIGSVGWCEASQRNWTLKRR